jgi:N-formylglutamate deformylase
MDSTDRNGMFSLARGSAPLVVSFPHAGTEIPPELAERMTPQALQRADVDWHLPQLYAFAAGLGATTIAARFARHVVDLNRPPEDTSLYPGQDVTGLLPTDTFRKEPLYRPGQGPRAGEAAERVERYWRPYHDALRTELERLRAMHGSVVLWDAHSIASVMPRFFDGKLPDLNLGTADGRACAPAIQAAVERVMGAQTAFTHVSNGRFKGGHITRHYGDPAGGVHALQLEMCQCTYMDETAPFAYRPDLAARVQPLLERMLDAVLKARA